MSAYRSKIYLNCLVFQCFVFISILFIKVDPRLIKSYFVTQYLAVRGSEQVENVLRNQETMFGNMMRASKSHVKLTLNSKCQKLNGLIHTAKKRFDNLNLTIPMVP